uniref:Gag-pol polyprotein n=1 Tax=Solanum tuberosum TaxID=4113 RepID=M1DDS5_SOLTU
MATCDPSPENPRNSSKCRPTAGPTDRRYSTVRSHIDRFLIFISAVLVIMPHRRAYVRNLLARSVTNKNNQQIQVPTNANVGSTTAARVQDFVRMNLPEFLGSQIGEDPQNFIDEVKKIFGVMQVTGNDRVELASYQLLLPNIHASVRGRASNIDS